MDNVKCMKCDAPATDYALVDLKLPNEERLLVCIYLCERHMGWIEAQLPYDSLSTYVNGNLALHNGG